MTLTKKVRIDEAALPVIAAMEWEETSKGTVGRITGGQLDRKLYDAVNKGLTALGGKWNRSMGGHIFSADPRPEIASLLGTGVVEVERDGFFPTPEAVTLRMIDMLANPQTPVLEPSAGDGAIARVVCRLLECEPADIHVVEKNDARRSTLSASGYTVMGEDFMRFSPNTLYQTIIMNPPFEIGQDVEHITHAFNNCLSRDGELVSVVSEGPFFKTDRDFQDMVGIYGYSETLPAGSFKQSGTGVNTRLVYLRK